VSGSYLTIARDVDIEVEVSRSRFLCRLRRVASEGEARAVIEATRKEHWNARHHCTALVIGPSSEVQRSNDDGEPSGTAGIPMLEVLRGREVSDVVAVVTRYFGGTLLGAGGLVRAYAGAVRSGLDAAGVRSRQLRRLVDVTASHASAGRIEHDLRTRGFEVRGVDYTASGVTIHAAAPPSEVSALLSFTAKATGGGAAGVDVGAEWVDV